MPKQKQDGGKEHLWTTLGEKRNKITDPQHVFLDTLSRLINNAKDKCIATFYDSNKDMIFIAGNRDKVKQANFYIEFLQKFANCSNEEERWAKYEILVNHLVIRRFYVSVIAPKPFQKSEENNTKKNFEEIIKTCHDKITGKEKQSITLKMINEIREAVKQMIREKEITDDNKIKNTLTEYLLFWEDFNNIVELFTKENLQLKVIKQAIKENKIKYLEGKDGLHAEMKILEHIYQGNSQLNNCPNYIGISKLCCAICYLSMEIIFGEAISFGGTHGCFYKGWEIPSINENSRAELLKRIKNARQLRGRESSGEIPEKLTIDLIESYKKGWIQRINDLKWDLGIAPERLAEGVEWENKLNAKENRAEFEEYAKELLRNIYQIAHREIPVDLQKLEAKIEIPTK